jgi:antagonist of KipI
MATLRVIIPGVLTTVQDMGRWGWQNQGVPVGGPMDPRAHRAANALVGNDVNDAALEVTLAGPELEFDDDRIVAVTGADFELSLNGAAQQTNAPINASAGSILRFGARRRGARACVAVSGGIDVAPVLGSRATHLPSAMGGIEGRPLRAGDRLPLGQKRSRGSFPAPDFLVVPHGHATVRVLPGPHTDRFGSHALDVLQSGPYVLEVSSNRMGFRLRGKAVAQGGGDMLSDATTVGAVQVPPSGQPILLMADRPTTGGYPIVATVISADIGLAGQLAPGDSISFVATTLRDAMSAVIALEQRLMAIESGAR